MLTMFNPVLTAAPARKFPGSKVDIYTPANSIFDGPITTLLSMLCILVDAVSCVHAKRGQSL